MSAKEVISTDGAPAALGPYSQAIKAGNTVYVSGQIGIVPGTKDFAAPDVEGQTHQVLKNMGAILKAAGADYKDVVKTTILLVSSEHGGCWVLTGGVGAARGRVEGCSKVWRQAWLRR